MPNPACQYKGCEKEGCSFGVSAYTMPSWFGWLCREHASEIMRIFESYLKEKEKK